MELNSKDRDELQKELRDLKLENSLLKAKLKNAKDLNHTENNNLFKNLTEITSIIYIVYQEDKIVYFNEGATTILGFSEDEFLQKRFSEFIHPDFHNIEKANRNFLTNGEKENISCELKLLKKNGSSSWFSFTCNRFEWCNNPAFICVAYDIDKRKVIEEELLKFKLCIEQSFEAIFITDRGGNIIFINPAFEQMYGFSPEEAIGKTPRILKSGTLKEEIYDYFWNTLLSKKPVTGEIINKTKDGKLLTIEGFNTSILDSNDDICGYVGVHRNITESKKAEESLKLFRSLIDNSYDAFEVVDPTSGRFIDVNKKGCEELGYSREEFLKLSVFDIDPVVDANSFAEVVKELRKSGSLTWEGIHKRKDNSTFPVEVNIQMAKLEKEYMVTVARDISKRKENEELVLKLSHAVEQSPVSIVITDKYGKIEYINPKTTEITGYTKEDVIGKNPRIFSSGEKPASEYKVLWENLLLGKEWNGEFRNKKKNGDLFWEFAHISPIVNPKGQITHFVAIKEDITNLKRMIDELIRAKEKAEASDRLKSAFLANMSHEIRTPMNGILGFTSLLLEPDLSDETKDEYIQIIHQSGERMLNTVTDIIEISKIEAGIVEVKNSVINIKDITDDIIMFFQPQAKLKGLALSFESELKETNLFINSDKNKFESILTNLIKNAIKYTDNGKITVSNYIKNGFMEFCIKDSGIGIPKHQIEAIFNRFEQADISNTRVFEGSGLGLAIAKSYIEMLGGKIWVESIEGEGSQFYFSLPYSPE